MHVVASKRRSTPAQRSAAQTSSPKCPQQKRRTVNASALHRGAQSLSPAPFTLLINAGFGLRQPKQSRSKSDFTIMKQILPTCNIAKVRAIMTEQTEPVDAVTCEAVRNHFIGWQCRIRQFAMREHGGRPSSGMRPRLVLTDGRELSPGIAIVIVPQSPEESTEFFRFQLRKTHDPHQVYERGLQYLSATHFQNAGKFSDQLTALFGPGSAIAAATLDAGDCILEFSQFSQTYRLLCEAVLWSLRMRPIRRPCGTTKSSIRILLPTRRSSPSGRTGSPPRPIPCRPETAAAPAFSPAEPPEGARPPRRSGEERQRCELGMTSDPQNFL